MTEAAGAPAWLRRAGAALKALVRWVGWWVAMGLISITSVGIAESTQSSGHWTLQNFGWMAVFVVPGLVLGLVLWRFRRSNDGAVASMVLTAGFWVSFWVVLWRQLAKS